ncbi:Hypothetical predicted protein, partial [Cloeon dipterum]
LSDSTELTTFFAFCAVAWLRRKLPAANEPAVWVWVGRRGGRGNTSGLGETWTTTAQPASKRSTRPPINLQTSLSACRRLPDSTTPSPTANCNYVSPDLKSELQDFNTEKLKNAETNEKNVLPTAEDVAQERTHQDLIKGVEDFDTKKLKHTNTVEKICLPDKEVVEQERVHHNLLKGVEGFDKDSMKHTETNEKNPLPDPEAIELEKGQQQLIAGIENFDAKSLKPTETQEKNPLPTKEVIEAEKSA